MNTPILIAPAVAVIAAQLEKRPEWQRGDPMQVSPAIYKAASEEMTAIMKKRGFHLSISETLKRNGVENFLIFGTPIVSNG